MSKPRRVVAAVAGCLAVGPGLAAADSHKILVLQSEGRADPATRAKIDAALVKLARTSEPQAAPGELSFSDAATAVGCKPEDASCKDEVLGMLAVDEIVITSVTPKPGGLELSVQRVTKGATRDATMLLATGRAPDRLDGIAPLFGATPEPGEPVVGEPARTGPPVIPAPATIKPPPPPLATPGPGAQPSDEPSSRRHRLELAGMIGGGSLLVAGVVAWSAAGSVQNDINAAPSTTRHDLANLLSLEAKADHYALAGNLLAVTGIIIGGIGAYYYIKDRRAGSSSVAWIAPAVVDHGAGLVLTIGGTP